MAKRAAPAPIAAAEPGSGRIHPAERLVFFTDAVVAIAMTLLILPLLESISEAAGEDLTAREWVSEHGGQLFSFALSFVLIATMWRAHHALFQAVDKYSNRLFWLNALWMFTIVWLPVGTALSGQLETDRTQVLLYVGAMLLQSVVMTAMQITVLRSPQLWREGQRPNTHGLSASLATAVLFAVCLTALLINPAIGYLVMFAMVLVGPLESVLNKMISRRLTTNPADPVG